MLSTILSMTLAASPGPAALDFFESRIRPVLVERCYPCHNSAGTRKGGLALDHREAMLEGGVSGAAVVPGAPRESLLLRAIRHEGELRMPKGEPRLSGEVVADFVEWIRRGAPDPRERPPSPEELREATSWEAIRARRKTWWSFRPIERPDPPPFAEPHRAEHPVDRFILRRLEESGLEPSGIADGRTLVRRLAFRLTGLPPDPGEIERFLADPSPDAYERLVDRLLAMPAFGERWARHWMDWFRYAESHGSEGDPEIPYAWRYRDYLIRALNADVPYDRLVREHVAGDLLPDPRIDPLTGIDESSIGVAHYRFVQHGYAPTDALDEQVRFTENQIDVLSKAFLGLTVACARCHDHKFDPVSQEDFYALYGVLVSSRPAVITVDGPERAREGVAELRRLKTLLRRELSAAWLEAAAEVPVRLLETGGTVADAAAGDWDTAVGDGRKNSRSPLHAWASARARETPVEAVWGGLRDEWSASRDALERRRKARLGARWNLAGGDASSWHRHGNGLREVPSPAGAFHILPDGDRVVGNIYPAGIYTHLVSTKHAGVLTSPRFRIESDALWVRVLGGGGARVRYAIQHYPRVTGPIYKGRDLEEDELRWVRFDMTYWKGDLAYVEVATAADLPVEARKDRPRSFWGITEVVRDDGGQPPRDEPAEVVSPLFEAAGDATPRTLEELASLYGAALRRSIEAWGEGGMSDAEARFLSFFVRRGLLPNELDSLPGVSALVARCREIEALVPVPVRAPGVVPGDPIDQPLFVRGNHREPGEAVPRRFLEFLDPSPYPRRSAGRLELAEDIVRPDNPLTARVIVNRIWHHLFGRGLVATTDNLGRLGSEPTHPELLDYLAWRFVREDGWSIKKAVRLLATSETFRRRSIPSEEARRKDPENLLLSFTPVRRLEAEAVRDALLSVSGRLDRTLFGPSAAESSGRRSIYLRARRNSPSPFLEVFDAPVPFTTTGRRAETNVPAQSLALMNDPLVTGLARAWARRAVEEASGARERIARMFETALSRPPRPEELERIEEFIALSAERRRRARERAADTRRALHEGRERIRAITRTARSRALAARSEPGGAGTPLPEPLACWEFEGDLRDGVGSLHGKPVGRARVEGGRLVLDGDSWVATAPLPRDVTEKTLEAWVVLSTLDQSGGGVLTLQTTDGEVFDSIVYAERERRRWMAGSDYFRRTKNAGGDEEDSRALETPVHVAIVYSADGTIALYRNGVPYGSPYRSSKPVRFRAGEAQVLLGMRHGTPSRRTGRLRGSIERARLHARALTADEVSRSARGDPSFVPRSELLAALSGRERSELSRLEEDVAMLDETLEELERRGAGGGEEGAWREVARTIFNLKEFIYPR